MAVLDPRDDSVVIRVVYDGAPMAGKTTSVGALGQCFGSDVHSPEELAGRTLYFDWLEYTGGWFDGHQIRCQIVSVPGQTTLAPRRRRLIESADVVVFVGSSSPAGVATDMVYLRELHRVLQARDGVPVGIVMQVNKRDMPEAVPLQRVHTQLEQLGLRVAVVESVAAQGTGVREAFVLAVRLALDRVRELMSEGKLATLPPSVDSAADLLRELQQGEDGVPTAAADLTAVPHPAAPEQSLGSVALRETVDAADHVHVSTAATPQGPTPQGPTPRGPTPRNPTPPDESVASGLLWPPVDGRLVLHEITAAPPELTPLPGGGWSGDAGRWHCHTASAEGFATLEQGRGALVEWARAHSHCQEILSKDRCIALVADASGCFRLWQVIKMQRTLHEYFAAALPESAEILAVALLTLIRSFVRMAGVLAAAPYQLPLSIDSIALGESGPCYAGRVPEPAVLQSARNWTQSDTSELLLEELQGHRAALHERRIEVLAALAQQVRASGVLNRSEWTLLQRIILKVDGVSGDSQRRSA